MAIHNEILTGRHNRLISKLFGMKGRAPSPQLSSEIQMSHPIFHGVENRWLESWNRYGARLISAAQAAANSDCKLENPAGRNVIVVVEKIVAIPTSAARIDVQFGQNAVSTSNSVSRALDGRNTSVTGASAQVNTGFSNAGQVGTTILSVQGAAATSQDILQHEDHELTLAPGDRISVQDQVQNEQLIVSFIWRERFLEESERQG